MGCLVECLVGVSRVVCFRLLFLLLPLPAVGCRRLAVFCVKRRSSFAVQGQCLSVSAVE